MGRETSAERRGLPVAAAVLDIDWCLHNPLTLQRLGAQLTVALTQGWRSGLKRVAKYQHATRAQRCIETVKQVGFVGRRHMVHRNSGNHRIEWAGKRQLTAESLQVCARSARGLPVAAAVLGIDCFTASMQRCARVACWYLATRFSPPRQPWASATVS